MVAKSEDTQVQHNMYIAIATVPQDCKCIAIYIGEYPYD